jgi:mannosyltransferase
MKLSRATARGTYGWPIAVLTVLGGALRLTALGTQSFDGDELSTAALMAGSFSDLFSSVERTEAVPYPYFLLLKGWAELFGTSEFSLRLPSAIAGALTVPVAALVTKELLSARAALLTAALVAVNPLLVWYSQQARVYALFALLGTLMLLYFQRALDGGRTRTLALWALWSALALLVHYFAIFLIVPQAVWLAVTARRHRRAGAVLAAASTVAIVAIALAPLAERQRYVPGGAGGVQFSSLAKRAVQVPKNFVVGPTTPAKQLVIPLAALLALAALAPLVRGGLSAWEPGVIIAAFVAVSAVVPPVVLAVIGVDYLTVRNVICGVVPFLMLVAAGATADRRSLLAALVLAALSLVVVISVATNARHQRPNLRGLADRIGAPTQTRVIALSAAGYSPRQLNVYLPGAQPLPASGAAAGELVIAGLPPDWAVPGRPPPLRNAGGPSNFRTTERTATPTYTLERYRAVRPKVVSPSRSSPTTPPSGSSLNQARRR